MKKELAQKSRRAKNGTKAPSVSEIEEKVRELSRLTVEVWQDLRFMFEKTVKEIAVLFGKRSRQEN